MKSHSFVLFPTLPVLFKLTFNHLLKNLANTVEYGHVEGGDLTIYV
jgi:hypothetical protein